MALTSATHSLSKARSQLLRPCTLFARGFAEPGTGSKLESDPRTTKPQQRAHDTDEATKDSIRHAAEGEVGEAVKDIGDMAKNAAKGAKESAKLMYDSMKEKSGMGGSSAKEDLKQDKP